MSKFRTRKIVNTYEKSEAISIIATKEVSDNWTRHQQIYLGFGDHCFVVEEKKIVRFLWFIPIWYYWKIIRIATTISIQENLTTSKA